MLSQADNDRLTHVGPGTPMGTLFRRYWIPACLSEELAEPDGTPVRVRLLGEDLIAYRDTNGEIGLVDAYCPHRRAPMFFGRNEDCGLRCVYHGWKFDRTVACVDMPSEPSESLFKTKVTIDAYPTWEGGGIIWVAEAARHDADRTQRRGLPRERSGSGAAWQKKEGSTSVGTTRKSWLTIRMAQRRRTTTCSASRATRPSIRSAAPIGA